jgi:lipoate-protein ligase A
MATDFLLLQRYPAASEPRLRHYGWRQPSFTFGYSQKIVAVRAALPADVIVDVCRRPTGGGIVDHRDDWTYAVVIPRGHPLEDARATQSYRAVHECLATALRNQGVGAVTKTATEAGDSATGASPAGVCFQRAEVFDVIDERTGEKIAGAAQKRNKQGLLFQGSLWRPAAKIPLDDERLLDDFAAALAGILETTSETTPWPDFNEDELSALTEQYSSPEWIEYR